MRKMRPKDFWKLIISQNLPRKQKKLLYGTRGYRTEFALNAYTMLRNTYTSFAVLGDKPYEKILPSDVMKCFGNFLTAQRALHAVD